MKESRRTWITYALKSSGCWLLANKVAWAHEEGKPKFRKGLKLGVCKLIEPKSTSFTVVEGPNRDEITLKGESVSWSVRSKFFRTTEEWGDRDPPKLKFAMKLDGEKIIGSCSVQITPSKGRSFLVTAVDSKGKMISKATFIHAAEGIALILVLGVIFMIGAIAGSFAFFTTSMRKEAKTYVANITCENFKGKVERFDFEASVVPVTAED